MYQQLTLADLQARLAERVESKPWWTPEDARLALNEGLRVYSAATGFWSAKYYAQTVPDDCYVSVPGSLVQATRCLWNGIPLEKSSLFEFDYSIPNWRGANTASGSPHPATPVYWAPVALNLLVIYPADHAGLNTLEVSGVRQTPLLVNPGDYLDLGQEELDVLLGYAQHVLALKVGGAVLVASYPGWLSFLKACGKANRQFAASKFYRRVLGLDQQRRLRRQEAKVSNPVDEVLQQASQAQGGG